MNGESQTIPTQMPRLNYEVPLFFYELPYTIPTSAGRISTQNLNALKKDTGRAVIGANFGDEGKGLITDYLCRTQGAGMVVRFPDVTNTLSSP